ncbi:lysophospholipase [Sorangium sp. So ce367]|uniref:alpha/beta hydrolase n=1 Tax=Sorangium sp. So ce367 TaxID=3133305 RepID=UPI003F6214B7
MKEETFTGRGGTRLHMRSWRPAGTPRAAVVLCHGVLAHSGQYKWSGEQLSAAGFAVYAYDHRGRGKSEGPRLFVNDIAEYTDDLGTFIALVKNREPGLNVFLLGHSMGGVISCTWALDHQREIAGFICESFAFEVWAPKPVLSLVRFLGRVTPKLPVLKLHEKDFTRDPQALQKLNSDPLTHGEVQPAGTVAALLKATDRMRAEFGTLTLPLLIMHGTEDKATVPAGSQLFHDKAGSSDKTLKLYEGHFHDLLNDLGKERVMADVVGWINARIA